MVKHARVAWQKPPAFATTSMERPVRNERRTPVPATGGRKLPAETQG